MKQAFTSNVYFFPDEVVYHTITNASLASHSLWSTRKKVKVTQRSQVNWTKKIIPSNTFFKQISKNSKFLLPTTRVGKDLYAFLLLEIPEW